MAEGGGAAPGGRPVSPGGRAGLAPVAWEDGLFEEAAAGGARALTADGSTSGRYLYLAAPEGFLEEGDGEAAVVCLDRGTGSWTIEYDSDDAGAPGAGAYRSARPVALEGSGEWREARVLLPGARFAGRQDGGADLRIAAPPGGLAVRAVRLRRLGPPPGPAGL